MKPSLKRALQYVDNVDGNATVAHFIEDHSPIGRTLWKELLNEEFVNTDIRDTIYITDKGLSALECATNEGSVL